VEKMNVEYFLKHARAVDINFYLYMHPEHIGLFIALRESGLVEAAKVNGKPIQLNPFNVD
jgi:hypothetical protein